MVDLLLNLQVWHACWVYITSQQQPASQVFETQAGWESKLEDVQGQEHLTHGVVDSNAYQISVQPCVAFDVREQLHTLAAMICCCNDSSVWGHG